MEMTLIMTMNGAHFTRRQHRVDMTKGEIIGRPEIATPIFHLNSHLHRNIKKTKAALLSL